MPEVSSGTVAPLSRRAMGPGAGRVSLPKPLTSFIGRERELAQAKRLLQDSSMVTLTGPGGSGKTRLSIAVAAEVAGDYPDGVYFVPLAPVRDPGLVPSTIVQSIGLQDARDVPLMEHLISQLRERRLLLVIDNFEHLLPSPLPSAGQRARPRRSPPGTWSAATVLTAGSGASSARPSAATSTHRTGCSPTSCWTGTCVRTPRMRSSGPMGCR
jgi:hypothetical protein